MLLLLFVAHSAAKKRAKLLLFFDMTKFFKEKMQNKSHFLRKCKKSSTFAQLL